MTKGVKDVTNVTPLDDPYLVRSLALKAGPHVAFWSNGKITEVEQKGGFPNFRHDAPMITEDVRTFLYREAEVMYERSKEGEVPKETGGGRGVPDDPDAA